ncbi:MAG: GDSL-type esterase/lipase family protein [Candidatus Micrarchaeia archaeon]
MAQVVLQNGVLVITGLSGGASRSSGVSVTASMSEADITAAIGRAKSNVAAFYYGSGDDRHGDEASRASGSASAIYRQLHPQAQPQEPVRQPQPPARTTPPRERRAAPQPPPREERRPAAPAARQPPRPTISRDWIAAQLRDAARDDRRALAASNGLRTNTAYLNQYLSPDLQRGVARTSNQTETTIAVFNALYQIPSFRLLLSALAADRVQDPAHRDDPNATIPRFADFVRLQSFLTEPGRTESLSEQASAEIIRAADYYIRYYLVVFAAPNESNARFRQELGLISGGDGGILWRMARAEEARTFTPRDGRQPTQHDRDSLLRPFLGGAMDGDTLVAASLFIRRWFQTHPESGRARTQDQIALWQAPPVTPLEEAAPQPVPQVAPQTTVPRVAVIGDSMLAGGTPPANGRVGETLMTALRRQNPTASVQTFAVVGAALPAIETQFRTSVIGANPPYNTLVMDGGINGITGMSVEDAERIYTRIIHDARAAGMRVVILTLTPWASYSGSNAEGQRRTALLNTWLRSQAGEGITIVDTSPLGEGNPPRLQAQYDSGDHLHPVAAGRDLLAQLIARDAFRIQPTASDQNAALQDFASRNWTNLATELYQAVSGGRPEAVVTIMRNRPSGSASVEEALRTLGRNDVSRAFDRIFNDFMRSDEDFRRFCRSARDGQYRGVIREGVSLSSSTSPEDRRLIIRAMQDYLNNTMASTGQDWYGRLRDDLRLLYRQILSPARDDLNVDSLEDFRTMAALAIYAWRKNHQTDAVGAWGPNLSLRLEQAAPVAPQPPPQPPQDQPREGERRRVIRF